MAWVYFIARRIGSLVVVLVVASFAVFSLLYLAPGSPLSYILGNRSATPEQIARVSERYHLNDPLFVRYWAWLQDVLHGDLGRSIVYRQDVTDLLGSRAPTTLALVVYAAVIIAIVGIGLGLLSALRPGKIDAAVSVLTTAFLSTPVFVVGVALISVFAVRLSWFPVFGAGSGVVGRIWHLTLPAVALSLASAGYLARITRASVSTELRREHVETARSRGLGSARIVRHHVFRNSLIPITTVLGVTIATLIAAAVVVEKVFAVEGLGSLLVDAILRSDFVVVQAVVLVLVTAFVVINTIVDVLYTVIDPRMSIGSER